MKRKVCFITGSRAEYGLLKPLMDELLSDKYFEVQIVITGMHLSPEFRLTYKEIDFPMTNYNSVLTVLWI